MLKQRGWHGKAWDGRVWRGLSSRGLAGLAWLAGRGLAWLGLVWRVQARLGRLRWHGRDQGHGRPSLTARTREAFRTLTRGEFT